MRCSCRRSWVHGDMSILDGETIPRSRNGRFAPCLRVEDRPMVWKPLRGLKPGNSHHDAAYPHFSPLIPSSLGMRAHIVSALQPTPTLAFLVLLCASLSCAYSLVERQSTQLSSTDIACIEELATYYVIEYIPDLDDPCWVVPGGSVGLNLL